MQGRTDYTLAKRAVLEAFRRGGLDRLQICDAHPELVRVARNIGRPMERPCPVCGEEELRSVRYVFGDQLRHLSGRPIYPDDWADELSARYNEFRCYEIEVCVSCNWNHLAACYLMGKSFNSSESQKGVKAIESEG